MLLLCPYWVLSGAISFGCLYRMHDSKCQIQFLFFRWCYTIQLNICIKCIYSFAYTIIQLAVACILPNLLSLVPTIFASWSLAIVLPYYTILLQWIKVPFNFGFILLIIFERTWIAWAPLAFFFFISFHFSAFEIRNMIWSTFNRRWWLRFWIIRNCKKASIISIDNYLIAIGNHKWIITIV